MNQAPSSTSARPKGHRGRGSRRGPAGSLGVNRPIPLTSSDLSVGYGTSSGTAPFPAYPRVAFLQDLEKLRYLKELILSGRYSMHAPTPKFEVLASSSNDEEATFVKERHPSAGDQLSYFERGTLGPSINHTDLTGSTGITVPGSIESHQLLLSQLAVGCPDTSPPSTSQSLEVYSEGQVKQEASVVRSTHPLSLVSGASPSVASFGEGAIICPPDSRDEFSLSTTLQEAMESPTSDKSIPLQPPPTPAALDLDGSIDLVTLPGNLDASSTDPPRGSLTPVIVNQKAIVGHGIPGLGGDTSLVDLHQGAVKTEIVEIPIPIREASPLAMEKLKALAENYKKRSSQNSALHLDASTVVRGELDVSVLPNRPDMLSGTLDRGRPAVRRNSHGRLVARPPPRGRPRPQPFQASNRKQIPSVFSSDTRRRSNPGPIGVSQPEMAFRNITGDNGQAAPRINGNGFTSRRSPSPPRRPSSGWGLGTSMKSPGREATSSMSYREAWYNPMPSDRNNQFIAGGLAPVDARTPENLYWENNPPRASPHLFQRNAYPGDEAPRFDAREQLYEQSYHPDHTAPPQGSYYERHPAPNPLQYDAVDRPFTSYDSRLTETQYESRGGGSEYYGPGQVRPRSPSSFVGYNSADSIYPYSKEPRLDIEMYSGSDRGHATREDYQPSIRSTRYDEATTKQYDNFTDYTPLDRHHPELSYR